MTCAQHGDEVDTGTRSTRSELGILNKIPRLSLFKKRLSPLRLHSAAGQRDYNSQMNHERTMSQRSAATTSIGLARDTTGTVPP